MHTTSRNIPAADRLTSSVAEGHVPDTPLNRALLQRTAANEANLAGPPKDIPEGGGILKTYEEVLPNGTQVWVKVRNGEINNGGIRLTPRVSRESK